MTRALDGDRQAMHALVQRLLPVVQTEVGYALVREARHECRDPRQEIRDFTQEVFISLFAERGRVLRSWNPERGCSFDSFMRLVARRRVSAILRSRHHPWSDQSMAGDALDLQFADEFTLAKQLESNDTLAWVLERLGGRLDERSLLLFKLLYVEERSVEEVMNAADMTRDAVYAWRLRFRKLAASLSATVRDE